MIPWENALEIMTWEFRTDVLSCGLDCWAKLCGISGPLPRGSGGGFHGLAWCVLVGEGLGVVRYRHESFGNRARWGWWRKCGWAQPWGAGWGAQIERDIRSGNKVHKRPRGAKVTPKTWTDRREQWYGLRYTGAQSCPITGAKCYIFKNLTAAMKLKDTCSLEGKLWQT